MTGVYNVDDKALLNSIKEEANKAVKALVEIAKPQKDDIFVVGCSSSEVLGQKIGTNSSLDVAKALFEGIYPVIKENDLYLAVQCCEHLNRAVIIEKAAADKYGYEAVNVIPQPKAGGSFATTAYENFDCAVAVEKISATLGIDIGLTMIGMHLKSVAVPVRLEIKKIGNAPIVCARTRPKFIGGSRAAYDSEKL
ncbi:MAG: TIGR01440 family protein [Ruminococcaceae bacterium]|nr:TIGR01440 family protein [Oscillospiraceae bacterium]